MKGRTQFRNSAENIIGEPLNLCAEIHAKNWVFKHGANRAAEQLNALYQSYDIQSVRAVPEFGPKGWIVKTRPNMEHFDAALLLSLIR